MGPSILIQILLGFLGTAVVVPVGETKSLRLNPDQRALQRGGTGDSFPRKQIPDRPEIQAKIKDERVVAPAVAGSMFCIVGKTPGITTVSVWGADQKRHDFLVVVPKPK